MITFSLKIGKSKIYSISSDKVREFQPNKFRRPSQVKMKFMQFRRIWSW